MVIAVAWDTAVVWVQILAQEPLHVRSTTKKKKSGNKQCNLWQTLSYRLAFLSEITCFTA